MAVTHLRDEQIRSCVRDALGGETLALRSAQAQGVQFSTPPLDAQTNEPQADEGRDLRLRRWRRREDLLAVPDDARVVHQPLDVRRTESGDLLDVKVVQGQLEKKPNPVRAKRRELAKAKAKKTKA